MPTIEERINSTIECKDCYPPLFIGTIFLQTDDEKEVLYRIDSYYEDWLELKLLKKRKQILEEWPKCQDLTLNLEQQYQKITI
ncbi:hypothetical protein CPT_Premi_023 [Proteus phage Premi]|uniref:Uncharacterized protein n=1 Tax=Proteus phage Premi TaxID=3097470 RepID=A0ABZ0ZXV0_9CAUD|nr:hypothetical protein CPT_Premi_023 [Proteus phage Premi]